MGKTEMINNNNTKVSLLILGCIFAACARVPETDFADEHASIPETDFADEHASIPETDFAVEHASISSAEGIGTSLHTRAAVEAQSFDPRMHLHNQPRAPPPTY